MFKSRFSQLLFVIVLISTLNSQTVPELAAQPSRETSLSSDVLKGVPSECPVGDEGLLCENRRPYETLASGANGGIREEQYLVVRSSEEFRALWRRIHRNRIPHPEPPELDFQRVEVIAAILGERPTGGYAVSVTRVCADGLVAVSREEPDAGSMVTQALTAPYHLVVTERRVPDRRDGNGSTAFRFCTIPHEQP